MWGSPLSFSSCSRFLCLLQPYSSWACRQQPRKICDLNLRHGVVYCWVLSGIIAFSSLLNMLVAVGWLKASPSKWKIFFLCSPFPLLQTHGHLASAVCSLGRGCQLTDKARWTRTARTAVIAVSSVGLLVTWPNTQLRCFDWIHCRNSRSCHI